MPIPVIEPYPMPTAQDVPAGRAKWTIRADRAVLLVHDMQRYFLKAFPPHQAPVTELVENTGRVRDACAAHGIPVVYTAQPGDMTPQERGLLADFWGPGMGAVQEDREIADRVAPTAGDTVLTKWRYSAFTRTDLLRLMRDNDRDQLIICGVYAHIGCLMTACEAFSLDIKPFLVADATADFSAAHHRMALTYAAQRAAAVRSTAAVLADLADQEPAGHTPPSPTTERNRTCP
ncbi:isochorismatase family protein [Streptomyces katrae]|uniref:Isochorismatase family protein n=1 Tax=Streptomyces katrae TaxID=68223 RepID=A0ABT7GRA2_9ACTN|nr:isochorismatase family protein [Streptomyces katrae]MDK9496113.1 isochorismatase family protein [Streptomyces katrae]